MQSGLAVPRASREPAIPCRPPSARTGQLPELIAWRPWSKLQVALCWPCSRSFEGGARRSRGLGGTLLDRQKATTVCSIGLLDRHRHSRSCLASAQLWQCRRRGRVKPLCRGRITFLKSRVHGRVGWGDAGRSRTPWRNSSRRAAEQGTQSHVGGDLSRDIVTMELLLRVRSTART